MPALMIKGRTENVVTRPLLLEVNRMLGIELCEYSERKLAL